MSTPHSCPVPANDGDTAPSNRTAPSGRPVTEVDPDLLRRAVLSALPTAVVPGALSEADDRRQDLGPVDDEPDEPDEPVADPDEDEDVLTAAARRLDWQVVCEAFAERCATAEAAHVARRHPLLVNPDLAVRRMCEVAEVASLIAQGDRPPLDALPDVRGAVLLASRGAILSSHALMEIAHVVAASNAARRFYRTRQTDAPLCWQQAEPMVALSELEHALSGVFDPDGELRDDASPELGQLRRRVRSLQDGLRTDIERRVHDRDVEPYLQDTYYTMREGRFVLPVRVQARGRIEGIVHATSASGQTIYVEPTDLVELNNRLRMADFDVRDEEQRILRRLSERIAEHATELAQNVARLFYLDLLRAAGDLAHVLKASVPTLGGDGVALKEARHPILVLRHEAARLEARFDDDAPAFDDNAIVANDIVLEAESRILVVSGSNAGGKTVTLKTLGLCALMMRAGLPIPASGGSRCPLFDSIVTDIGDEQSISRDTSTFSAHVLNLRRFLPLVGARSLVLLDEPFSGTDPAHAGALAIALLEHLHDLGATVVVTTHLDRVKAYALETPWLSNASVDFDVETMRPTYRLHLGVPGGSSALRIARRLGLDGRLITRAHELRRGDPTGELDVVIRRLERSRRALDEERGRLSEAEREVSRESERLRAEIERARNRGVRELGEDALKVQRALRSARGQIAAVEKQLKEEAREQRQSRKARRDAAAKARKDLEAAETAARDAERLVRESSQPDRARVDPDAIETGMRVYSRNYQQQGTVVAHDRRGVTLQVGAFQVTVTPDDLYRVESRSASSQSSGERRGKSRRRGRSNRRGRSEGRVDQSAAGGGAAEAAALATVPQTPDNTVDLRGMRTDEAVERVDMFLDSVLRKNLPNAFLIHGHGTGALKRAVRAHVASSRYVSTSRPGDRHEGGDGVTVVYLS